jgi:hypothetical protein
MLDYAQLFQALAGFGVADCVFRAAGGQRDESAGDEPAFARLSSFLRTIFSNSD